jgi:hypothetical protein
MGGTMARTTRVRNGSEDLKDAIALLLANQARFVSHLDEDRQRFSRIERDLDELKVLAARHEEDLRTIKESLSDLPATIQELFEESLEESLRDLPEAIRQKIGFKQ